MLTNGMGEGKGGIARGWGVGNKGRHESQERTMSATISDHIWSVR